MGDQAHDPPAGLVLRVCAIFGTRIRWCTGSAAKRLYRLCRIEGDRNCRRAEVAGNEVARARLLVEPAEHTARIDTVGELLQSMFAMFRLLSMPQSSDAMDRNGARPARRSTTRIG